MELVPRNSAQWALVPDFLKNICLYIYPSIIYIDGWEKTKRKKKKEKRKKRIDQDIESKNKLIKLIGLVLVFYFLQISFSVYKIKK